MSYCRWSEDSDVYVYEREVKASEWVCCGCAAFPTREAMIEHLREHEERGHRVPVAAIARLRAESKAVET